MTNKIYIIIALFITLTVGAVGGYQYGTHQKANSPNEEWTAWDLEQAEIELDAIYHLLAAHAFTSRTNMNMSFKTNQYMTKIMKEQDIDPAIDKAATIEYLEHLVENMPELEGGNKMYFDTFYRAPLERLKNEE
tara:strand:+ start:43991 stop:44392 length:402 start_codon:yes stop_codon:yes gene_type:complete